MADKELIYNVESILEHCIDIKEVVFQISYFDFSGDNISVSLFTRIIDNWFSFPAVQKVRNQVLILEEMIKNGLDFNVYPEDGQFSYGQIVMRHSKLEVVQCALDNGFDFDSYTSNNWHCLELFQLNCLASKNYKDMMKIIKSQLEKGIDLSKSDPDDFFKKLKRMKDKESWNDLIELYKSDTYMLSFIKDNIQIVLKNELNNIIPKELQDIFLF